MERSVRDIVDLYKPLDPLEEAWTIPAPWYFDTRIAELERASVFSATWQAVGRADQVRDNGQFFTAELAGEPLVVVARRRWKAARLLQCVPPSRGRRGHRGARLRKTVSLSLPRLDIRNRRRVEGDGRI